MSLDTETVRNIAYLARIRVDDADLAPLAVELSQIMDWVEQLNTVDTDNVEPLASVSDVTLPRREDVVTSGDLRDKVLANATEPVDGFYSVPKVVE